MGPAKERRQGRCKPVVDTRDSARYRYGRLVYDTASRAEPARARSARATSGSATPSSSARSSTATHSNRGTTVEGPAVIEERESTCVLGPGDRATVDAHFNLVAELANEESDS